MVILRKGDAFAKENVAGLGMRVNFENAVAFLWRKVGAGANNTAKTKIPSNRARTRYRRDIKEVCRSPCLPRGTSYPVIDTAER
jgi:hypothetical protein